MPAVRTACLFIDSDSPLGSNEAAFLPIAGAPLIARVAHGLAAAGLEQLIILAPAQWPVLKRLAHDLKQRGLTVAIVTKASDLADYIRADRSLLLVQEGILPSRALIDDALDRRESIIYTRPVASSDDRHERIDLADRWTGVAVVPGSLVHNMDDCPEDWSVVSALLRHGVQKGIDRKQLDIKPGSMLRADMLIGERDGKLIEQRLMSDYFNARTASYKGLLAYVGKWASARLLPMLWRRGVDVPRLSLLLLAGGVLTLVLAMLGWLIAAVLAGLVTLVGKEIYLHYLGFSIDKSRKGGGEAMFATLLLLSAAVPVMAVALHGLTLAVIAAGLLFPLILFAISRLGSADDRQGWRGDPATALLLLLFFHLADITFLPSLLSTGALLLAVALLPVLKREVKANLTQKS